MTITRRSFTTLLGGTLVAAPAIVRAQQVTELRLGHVLAEHSSYQVAGKRLDELVAEKTDGALRISLFASSSLGGELRLIQSARVGAIDLMFITQSTLENTVRDLGVLSLPWLFDSYEQATQLMTGPLGARLLGTLEPFGMTGLGWINLFERSVATNRPFSSLAEGRGLKIRVIQSPGYIEAYKAIGMAPTPIVYTELFLALQNGVVDAAELATDQLTTDKFIETVRHFVLTRTHQLPSALVASTARLNALPSAFQAAIRESAPEALAAGLSYYNKLRAESLEEMRRRGIQIVEPDLAQFQEPGRKSYNAILATAPSGRALLAAIEEAKQAA